MEEQKKFDCMHCKYIVYSEEEGMYKCTKHNFMFPTRKHLEEPCGDFVIFDKNPRK